MSSAGHSLRGSKRCIRLAALLCFIALAALTSSSASACTINGIPSLSLNGVLATKTTIYPTFVNLPLWAPFTFQDAVTPGVGVRMAEDVAKLRATLPAAALRIPFHWTLGDGTAAQGVTVVHTYQREGWYRVEVRGYWPERGGWAIFDTVRVHVVAPQAPWQAGLPYAIPVALLAAGLILLRSRRSTRKAPR